MSDEERGPVPDPDVTEALGTLGEDPRNAPDQIRLPLGRNSLVAMAGTALSRLTGFLRLAAMIYALGVAETKLADTYNLANTTPLIIYELVLGGVLSAVVLRVYLEVRHNEGEEAGWLFITRLSNAALIGLTILALIGIVAAPLVIKAYTFRAPPDVRAAQQVVGSMLLALFIPQVIFYGLNTIATAVLRAQGRFGVFMFAPVLNNLAVIFTFIGLVSLVAREDRSLDSIPTAGIVLLGAGTTFGVVLMGLVPWVYSKRVGRRRMRRAGLADPHFRRLARLSAYTVGYVVTNQLGLWAILVLANQIQGGVAARETAFAFFSLPHGLLAVSISMVVGTTLARQAVAGRLEGFALELTRGLRGIAFVVLPAAAGYLAIAPEILRVTIEHGVATPASTELVSAALRGYAVGLFFFSAWHLVLSSFQALGDTRTPMRINIVAFAAYVGFAVVLFNLPADPRLRIGALGLSHAVSYVVAAMIGLRILRRRLPALRLEAVASTVARSALAATVTGAGAWGAARLWEGAFGVATLASQTAQILIATSVGLLLYAAGARALRMEEMAWLKGLTARMLRTPGR